MTASGSLQVSARFLPDSGHSMRTAPEAVHATKALPLLSCLAVSGPVILARFTAPAGSALSDAELDWTCLGGQTAGKVTRARLLQAVSSLRCHMLANCCRSMQISPPSSQLTKARLADAELGPHSRRGASSMEDAGELRASCCKTLPAWQA